MRECSTKGISIHKSNAMIRGGNTYSLNAQRLGNGIYNYIQKNSHYEDKPFMIPIQEVREIMNLENTNAYVDAIKRALSELSKPFVLYNPKDLAVFQTKGKEVLWKSVQFLVDAEIVKEGRKIYISGKLTGSIRTLIANSKDSNFTPLLLNGELMNIKSKHSLVLYEYIISYDTHPQYKNRIELGQERMDKMFNLKDAKKYKYFSSFLPVLKRCIVDINKNTDLYLKLAVDKKRKKYIIYRIREYDKKILDDEVVFIETKKENKESGEDGELAPHPLGMFRKD